MGLLPLVLAQDSSNAAGAAILGGLAIFWIVLILIALAFLALWIWALVDCIKREFPGENDKMVWLIVLIVSFVVGLSWLAAIIYLIVGRKKGTLPGTPSTPTPPSEPTEPSK